VNYQSIGSGGGIAQIKAKTVTFGATDKPLGSQELATAGLTQFPVVIGGIVPVVNVPGLKPGELTLDGQTLALIFLGKISRWDDPAIKKLNPGVGLPAKAISVVHRSDGSGTTFQFSTYLSRINADWKANVGADTAIEWPAGIGGKGNEGVAGNVGQISGAIGYVEYAYAKQNNATFARLQNKSGQFPPPVAASFGWAAANADWAHAPGNYILLLDQPGPKAWPITGATFILVYKDQADAATGASVLKFFDWAYKGGDQMAVSLDYVPLGLAVKNMIRKQWGAMIKAGGKPVYVSR
jgi:phosphate transport system substrate-binding protein